MLEKIIVGVLIGLVAGFFLSRAEGKKRESSAVILIFLAIISIAFIGSSFIYGAVYGLMAIGEIATGFFVAANILEKRQ